jgi:hypothetical protein
VLHPGLFLLCTIDKLFTLISTLCIALFSPLFQNGTHVPSKVFYLPNSGDKVKKAEMGRACRTYGGE